MANENANANPNANTNAKPIEIDMEYPLDFDVDNSINCNDRAAHAVMFKWCFHFKLVAFPIELFSLSLRLFVVAVDRTSAYMANNDVSMQSFSV